MAISLQCEDAEVCLAAWWGCLKLEWVAVWVHLRHQGMADRPMHLAVGDCWGSPGVKLALARCMLGWAGPVFTLPPHDPIILERGVVCLLAGDAKQGLKAKIETHWAHLGGALSSGG